MGENKQAPLAAIKKSFGVVDMDKVAKNAASKKGKEPDSKYEQFLGAIKGAAFGDKDIEQRTRLEWDNIEGEVMGFVLVEDLLSGTMFVQRKSHRFRFKSVESQMEAIFLKKFFEVVGHHPYIIPAITVSITRVNQLMISYKGMGREELVRMLQAFSITMQDSEKSDTMMKRGF